MSQGSFLEALKTYLQRLTSHKPASTAAEPPLDPVWARNLLLKTLERVERGEADPLVRRGDVTQQLEDWLAGDRVVVFARELQRLMQQSLAPGASLTELRERTAIGLLRWFGLPGALPSRVQTAQLDRLVEEARTLAWQTAQVFVGLDIVRYAKANRLTVQQDGRVQVSPLGQVLQHLEGRDAVRWLLQVEAQQALGLSDPDRLSREAARQLLVVNHWTKDQRDDGCPCNYATARRMRQLGILAVDDNGGPDDWSVSVFGQELLEEVASAQQTPLSLLAESLCSDLVHSTVDGMRGRPTGLHFSAAEATARQARMMTHEVRNALLPVQAALDSLYREVVTLPPVDVLARRRKVIDDGIRGALRFTRSLLQTAELGAKPPQPFEPVHAIGDVLAELALTTAIRLDGPGKEALPLLQGRREHFVLAVRNLIQNAIQHGGPTLQRVLVSLELDPTQAALRLTVDDDGRGVSESERDRIFEEGVTNQIGGTGLGLALVKQVFERDFRGVVVCSQSPLGGARFVVRLPIGSSGQRAEQKEPSR